MDSHPEPDLQNPLLRLLIERVSSTSPAYINLIQHHFAGAEKRQERVYPDCIYHIYPDLGNLSFCFDLEADANRLAAVHVFRQLPAAYDTLLPYGIRRETTLVDFVRQFAPVEPEKGGGGRVGPGVWVRYKRHGLQVEFHARTWTDGNVQWVELTLTQPETV